MTEINDLMPDNLIEVGTNAVNTLLPSNTEAIADVPYATSAGTLYEEKRVLDITKVSTSMSIAKALYLRRGEGNATTLIAEVKDAGATLNLTGFTATFKMLNPNNQYVNVPASIDNAASGEVSVVIPHDMTEVSGGTEIAYFEFTNGTEIATTNDIPIVVLDSNDLTPDQQAKYQTQIDKMIAQLEQKIITSVKVEYKTHTTNASVPTGTWSTSLPVAGSGQWLWTRRTTTYRDGTTTVEYSYAYQGKDNANYGVATTTQQGLMSGEMVSTLNSLKTAWDSAGFAEIRVGIMTFLPSEGGTAIPVGGVNQTITFTTPFSKQPKAMFFSPAYGSPVNKGGAAKTCNLAISAPQSMLHNNSADVYVYNNNDEPIEARFAWIAIAQHSARLVTYVSSYTSALLGYGSLFNLPYFAWSVDGKAKYQMVLTKTGIRMQERNEENTAWDTLWEIQLSASYYDLGSKNLSSPTTSFSLSDSNYRKAAQWYFNSSGIALATDLPSGFGSGGADLSVEYTSGNTFSCVQYLLNLSSNIKYRRLIKSDGSPTEWKED